MEEADGTVAARVAALRQELRLSPSENSTWDAFIEDHGEKRILDHLGHLRRELACVRELGFSDLTDEVMETRAAPNPLDMRE